ncbi:MAG: HAD domain-containing protein [Pseudomonas sp.]
MAKTFNPPSVLFLDFDGVLHPDAVFMTRKGPKLRAEGSLFMWADLLVEVLEDFPHVQVVLSTSWVRHLGFSRARSYLPAPIKARVIGATWHSSMGKGWLDQNWWDSASRYEQICRYVDRAHLRGWVSVDDDSERWPEEALSHLVRCDGQHGLAQSGRVEDLRNHLRQAN